MRDTRKKQPKHIKLKRLGSPTNPAKLPLSAITADGVQVGQIFQLSGVETEDKKPFFVEVVEG